MVRLLISFALLCNLSVSVGCVPFHCVSAGTLIATPVGERPVESLREGDEVLARSPSGEIVTSRVIATRRVADRRVMQISLVNGRELRLTSEHPVLVGDEYVRAGDLREGMSVRTEPGESGIASIQESGGRTDVYDLTVSPHHNFIAEGVVVHNKSFLPPPVSATDFARDYFLVQHRVGSYNPSFALRLEPGGRALLSPSHGGRPEIVRVGTWSIEGEAARFATIWFPENEHHDEMNARLHWREGFEVLSPKPMEPPAGNTAAAKVQERWFIVQRWAIDQGFGAIDEFRAMEPSGG